MGPDFAGTRITGLPLRRQVDAHTIGAALQHAIFELRLRGKLLGDEEADHDQEQRESQPGEAGGEAAIILFALALEVDLTTNMARVHVA